MIVKGNRALCSLRLKRQSNLFTSSMPSFTMSFNATRLPISTPITHS